MRADIDIWLDIDGDGITFPPVRRNLQDGRAADATVGEEQGFPKGSLAVTDLGRRGNT